MVNQLLSQEISYLAWIVQEWVLKDTLVYLIAFIKVINIKINFKGNSSMKEKCIPKAPFNSLILYLPVDIKCWLNQHMSILQKNQTRIRNEELIKMEE